MTDSTPPAGELDAVGVPEQTVREAYVDWHAEYAGNSPPTPWEAFSAGVTVAWEARLAALPAQPPRIEGAGREEIAALIREHVSGIAWLDGRTRKVPATVGSENAADAILSLSAPQRMAGGDGAGVPLWKISYEVEEAMSYARNYDDNLVPQIEADWNRVRDRAVNNLDDELQAVTAERDRMRDALEEIAAGREKGSETAWGSRRCYPRGQPLSTQIIWAGDKARTALSPATSAHSPGAEAPMFPAFWAEPKS